MKSDEEEGTGETGEMRRASEQGENQTQEPLSGEGFRIEGRTIAS